MKVRVPSELQIKTSSGHDIWVVMNRILLRLGKIRQKKEYFWVVGLSRDSSIDFVELINIGSVSSVYIEARELFRIAVIQNVERIIFVHNHPSGNVRPSDADKRLTNRMIEAGSLLGVEITDHVIITSQKYFSFAEKNLL